MAGEIQLAHYATDVTLKAVVRSSVGTVWNGVALIAYATADIAAYAVSMVEQGAASQYYVGTFPTLPAGVYQVSVYQLAGGSLAEGDICVAVGEVDWDGSAVTVPPTASEVMTSQMTESYNADGAAPTPAQALFAILQRLTEFTIVGTTITVKKLDGLTPALTLTMNDDEEPTSSTRAS